MGCLVGNNTEENVSRYQFSKLDAFKDVSYMSMHYINDPLYPIYVYYKYYNKDIIEAKAVEAKVKQVNKVNVSVMTDYLVIVKKENYCRY